MLSSSLTFNQFLLPENDLVTQRALFVVLQYQQVSPPHLMFLQQPLALHTDLHHSQSNTIILTSVLQAARTLSISNS